MSIRCGKGRKGFTFANNNHNQRWSDLLFLTIAFYIHFTSEKKKKFTIKNQYRHCYKRLIHSYTVFSWYNNIGRTFLKEKTVRYGRIVNFPNTTLSRLHTAPNKMTANVMLCVFRLFNVYVIYGICE